MSHLDFSRISLRIHLHFSWISFRFLLSFISNKRRWSMCGPVKAPSRPCVGPVLALCLGPSKVRISLFSGFLHITSITDISIFNFIQISVKFLITMLFHHQIALHTFLKNTKVLESALGQKKCFKDFWDGRGRMKSK